MKFTIPKPAITEIINKMGRLLSAKSSIPILAGILVQAQNDCILFTVSDGTESLIHRLKVNEEAGIVVEEIGSNVFMKETFETIKKMSGIIKFEANESTVVISQDKTSLQFAVALASDYPKIEIENTENGLAFNGADFESIIKKTTFAVSHNDSRPILTGVNMSFGSSNKFVATDSHRLARMESGTADTELSITVPASVLNQALKSFDFSQTVRIFPGKNQIGFLNGTTILTSRLLEGNFPDTNRLIPTEFTTELTMNKEELVSSLELLSVLADNKVIQLTVNGMSVELCGKGTTSKGTREIFYEEYVGEEGFTISFSAQYALEAIRTITTSSVKMSFTGNMRPFILTPTGENSSNELQLILPVRTI